LLEPRKVAEVEHPGTSRRLEVWSDQPGLELYTGNFLPTEVGAPESLESPES
jgi:galactose mutarotase-like enzyme